MNPPRVSVAIPVFNEEQVLPELYRRVRDVLAELPGVDHEIVFVDDGSSDGTFELLEAIATIDPQVRAIALSRNFGHQAALTAALDQAQGDVVVLMDGDLQDAPEAIPMFLAQYAAGYDVVYAIRRQRKEGLLKRGCYAAFYRIISRMAEIDLPRDAGDFSLLSRRVVDAIRRSPERHRYLRGLRSWVGFRQIGVPVNRDARSAGESKYGPRQLLKLAFDGIFSFSVLPLRLATVVGAMVVLGSAAFAGYATFVHLFFSRSPQGFTALIVAVVFLAGIQLLFLGVCGEYIGRIYEQVKQRPQYVVDRIVTANADGSNSSRQPADQLATSPAASTTTTLASC